MLHSNKSLFFILKLGVTIFIISSLFSCSVYRYFPSRIQQYSFDTCKEVKLILEPYRTGFLQLGYNVGAAYSITNHFAVDANYHRDLSWNCCGDADPGEYS